MFNYIASGSTRIVYAINDDMVIKIAQNMDFIDSWGVKQCHNELTTFKEYGDKLPLCKIFVDMSSETRIVMERVISITDHPNDYDLDELDEMMHRLYSATEDEKYLNSIHPHFREFAKKILKSGLTREDISNILYDVESHNIGIKDDELIIYDYGLLQD
jgi:hypothetical protein